MLRSGFEFTQALPLAVAFAARQRDVGLIGPALGSKPAKRRRLSDSLLKQKQLRRDPDAGKEDPGTFKAAKFLKPYLNRPQTQLVQLRNNAFVLLRAGIAQKLDRDVPRFTSRPAQPIPIGSKPHRDFREFVDHCCSQRYPNKKAHEEIIQGIRQIAQPRRKAPEPFIRAPALGLIEMAHSNSERPHSAQRSQADR